MTAERTYRFRVGRSSGGHRKIANPRRAAQIWVTCLDLAHIVALEESAAEEAGPSAAESEDLRQSVSCVPSTYLPSWSGLEKPRVLPFSCSPFLPTAAPTLKLLLLTARAFCRRRLSTGAGDGGALDRAVSSAQDAARELESM